jgi:hypothetical protein
MPCLRLYVPTLREAPDGKRISSVLCREPGVYSAIANCGEKVVEIDFEDDEVTVGRLVELVRDLGHDVRLAG